MLRALIMIGIISLYLPEQAIEAEQSPLIESLYDLGEVYTADESLSLASFKGKVTLVVNTASRCGFTYQLKDMEELHRKYRDRGFSVLAFPSNDYAGQEPGNDEEIARFCTGKYDTSFPIFPKAPPHCLAEYRSGEPPQDLAKDD